MIDAADFEVSYEETSATALSAVSTPLPTGANDWILMQRNVTGGSSESFKFQPELGGISRN